MKTLKSHQGIGLPAMLAIVTFLIATIGGLLTFSLHQARLLERTIQTAESEIEANNALKAAIHIIIREQSLDSNLLNQLKTELNIDFTIIRGDFIQLSHPLYDGKLLTSYISGSASTKPVEDALFQYTGKENDFPIENLLLLTPHNLFNSYISEYYDMHFPDSNLQTSFFDFGDVFSYFKLLSLNTSLFDYVTSSTLANYDILPQAHWFIDDSYTLGNGDTLIIPSGYLLFINGNLTLNRGSTIEGNVIVNGDVNVLSHGNNTQTIRSTLYIAGNFVSDRRVTFGTQSRPTFVFAEGNITIGNQTSGVGYFLSKNFDAKGSGSVSLVGGVYALNESNLGSASLVSNDSLITTEFSNQAVPSAVYVSSDESNNDSETIFLFTSPRVY